MEKSLESPPSDPRSQFFSEIEKAEKVEEKVRLCLDFMKRLASEENPPQFRAFWEARSLCLDLFKETLAPRLRTAYWSEFILLSDEIRKVKKILDEQSTFAAEQIELAIKALEKDLTQTESLCANMDPIDIPKEAKVLQSNSQIYIESQKELDFLETFTGRINSLRKELIHIPMRVRYKNRLFGELGKLGDAVFPRRKEAIAALSDCFCQDIEKLKLDFDRTFESKEQIKALQSFAKRITIHAKAFSSVREKLSTFWDQIKEKEKQRHLLKAKQRDAFRENFEKIAPQIDLLKKQCTEESLSFKAAQLREKELLAEMRQLSLGRDEVKLLKKRLAQALEPLEKKHAEIRMREIEREKLKEQEREKAREALVKKLAEVLDRAESFSHETLVEKWDALVKEGKALSTVGLEGERILRKLDAVYDHIQEKKWHLLRDEQSEEGIQKLHALLDNRHKARQKLKQSLESYRKRVGGSGLSLNQSLLYHEMIGEEKLRLDAIETMIEELEEKLFDVEE